MRDWSERLRDVPSDCTTAERSDSCRLVQTRARASSPTPRRQGPAGYTQLMIVSMAFVHSMLGVHAWRARCSLLGSYKGTKVAWGNLARRDQHTTRASTRKALPIITEGARCHLMVRASLILPSRPKSCSRVLVRARQRARLRENPRASSVHPKAPTTHSNTFLLGCWKVPK
jgi:hypothetical protein